jgi:hypothetical protein
MTLKELSVQYRLQADALRVRIQELTLLREQPDPDTDPCLLEDRLRILSAMWREARDLSMLTEHYYERGYHRNARYTV